MTETMTTSEVLHRAADLIEERGWWQAGDLQAAPDSVCAANAIREATSRFDASRVEGWYALAHYLGGRTNADIWAWNDAPDRTASEVIEVLRACALLERAKECSAIDEVVSV